MQERGIDITAHRAKQLNRQMCLESDMVLVMDAAQRARVEALYPQARGRVFKIGEYTRRDIPDPYGQTEPAFRKALSLIEEGLTEWLKRIRKL